MAIQKPTNRVTVTLPKWMLEIVDHIASERKQSRSQVLVGLLDGPLQSEHFQVLGLQEDRHQRVSRLIDRADGD